MTDLEMKVLHCLATLRDGGTVPAIEVADECFMKNDPDDPYEGLHSKPRLYKAQMYLGRLRKKGWAHPNWTKGSTLWEITCEGRHALKEAQKKASS